MLNFSAQQDAHMQILSQTGFFAGLCRDQLMRVSSASRIEERSEGHQFYKIGETAKTLYVLIDGTVRFSIGYGKREASAGDILRRGQVFGWSALTPTFSLRIATASCLSPCSVLAVDGGSLLHLMEQDHTLGFRLTSQLNVLITGTLTAFAGG
jgi:toluene monooxygenase system ferredoxin subunit